MIAWLIDVLGLQGKIPPGAEVRFEWGNLPRGESGLVVVLACAGAVLLTAWLYRREGSASALRKGSLAALRLLVFAALLGVFCEPRLAVDMARTVEGQTIVLWDTSLSMGSPDTYVDEARRKAVAEGAGLADPADLAALTRQEVAWRIIEQAKLLQGLEAKNQLLIYGFDSDSRRLTPPIGEGSLKSAGQATDLAAATRKALEDTGGRSVAAVIAITDGRINKGEGKQGVIHALKGRRIPFYAIGVGDPTPPLNLKVIELQADERVMLGDPLAIEGRVQARGLVGQTVEAIFSVRKQGAAGATVLERRPVTFEVDERPVALRFTFKPEEAGDLVFELQLPAREEELDVEDNIEFATTKVSDDKTKVLLIAGSPTFEYHFLKTRLIREKSAVVSCWLQSADESFPQEGNETLESMPRTLDALRPFDCIILLDPSADDFDAPLAEALKSFVADTKGGLLVIPGPKYGAGFLQGVASKPIRDLLPVIVGDLGGSRITATEQFPYKVTPDGIDHPATRLDPNPETCRSYWSRVPGAFFSYPVERAKAGAVVLVRHEDPSTVREQGHQAVVAAHFFDGAPVIFQGTDELWRWRSVAPTLYDRYWVGVLRYLVQGRVAGGRKRIELLPDKKEYVLGEPIRLRAQAFDRSYRPLELAELRGMMKHAGEETEFVLLPSKSRGGLGWYEGVVLPPGQGEVEFTLRLPDDEPGATPESEKVKVKRPDLEFAERNLDEETLRGIAEETSGTLVRTEDVPSLPERIESKTEHLVVAGAPVALWDQWQVILLVCAFLSIEWFVRKRSKMV